MSDFINKGNNYTSNSIIVSRNLDERVGVINNNSSYSAFSNLIISNMSSVDSFIEGLSRFTGDIAALKVLDNQYHLDNSKTKSFFNRNVYIDPVKEQTNMLKRQGMSAATALGMEIVLKNGVRFAANKFQEKGIYNYYYNLYSFLDFYAFYDMNNSNFDLTNIELKKIRASFDLSDKDKKKLEDKTINNRKISISDTDLNFISKLGSEEKKSISYLLYSIAVTKYPDDRTIDNSLLKFYDVLGYQGGYAKDVLEENKNAYSEVTDNQHMMNQIAAGLVAHMGGRVEIELPIFDVSSIMQRSQQMTRYDPYYQRRKNVQKVAAKGAKIGGGLAFSAVCSNFPQLAMLSATEAFSQFNMDNPNMLEMGSKLLNTWFRDSTMEKEVLDESKNLKNQAIKLN